MRNKIWCTRLTDGCASSGSQHLTRSFFIWQDGDSPSFSKWKSEASNVGLAIWQNGRFSILLKVKVRRKPSDIISHMTFKKLLAFRQGIFSLKSCTSRNLTAKLSRILHSYPFARQQVWISQNGSVLKKRNFPLFLDHRLIPWRKSGRGTTF